MLAVLPLATSASNVTSGAVLTLVLPIGFTIIALATWWYLAVHTRSSRERPEPPAAEPEPAPGSAPQ
jgi:hypothetical protein